MGIFRIRNTEKLEKSNKESYVGPVKEVLFLQQEEDIKYLRGTSVDLIVCNFAKTNEIHKEILPSISDGYYQTGIIKYLK